MKGGKSCVNYCLQEKAGEFTWAGLGIVVVGLYFVGKAGMRKEKEQVRQESTLLRIYNRPFRISHGRNKEIKVANDARADLELFPAKLMQTFFRSDVFKFSRLFLLTFIVRF